MFEELEPRLFLAANSSYVEAVSTFNNVGVDVLFANPLLPGTTVSMSVKEIWASKKACKAAGGSNKYLQVHPLSPLTASNYAGSVFGLKSDTEYSISLAGKGVKSKFTVRTRADSFPAAIGTTYHVDPVNGDDTNDGTTAESAFKTLAKGLSVASAGTEILMYDGVYYEGDLIPMETGALSAPIVICNAPGANPILDGTETDPSWLESGWELYDLANNVYRATSTRQPGKAYIDGEHLYRYTNLADLTADEWETGGGYYADGSNFYVRCPGGGAPDEHEITIPKYSMAISLWYKRYYQISGIEFAHYSTQGMYLEGAGYNLIDGCSFHNTGFGIAMRGSSNYNTIQNNHFDGGLESAGVTWSYSATGAGGYAESAVLVCSSSNPNKGNVIRYNLIEHMRDGVHLYSQETGGPTQNMDFHDNLLLNNVDDGIETDGCGSNVRIYDNTLDGFLTGISVAPANGGPTYIMNNVLVNWHSSSGFGGYPFKFNNGSGLSTNWVYIYHNTCYTDEPWQNGFLFKGYSLWQNIVSRNNIYIGTYYALDSWPSSTYDQCVDLDYDNIYTTNLTLYIRWAGQQYGSLGAFSEAVGHESNGICSIPGFVDVEGGNYHLASGSAMIDKGVFIPGVNNGFFGLAPDLGAFESN